MLRKRKTGYVLAETAASCALLLPLLILILFVVAEASYGFFLKATLAEAARQAARDLAISYGQDPTIVGNRAKQNAAVFDKIRIFNVVNSSVQFQDPVFNTTVQPYTVSTSCQYLSGQYGLPRYPNPDVLKLPANFMPQARCTYKLE